MPCKLHLITEFVEQRKTSFTVSRLIMMTGVKLRSYLPESVDDPVVLKKIQHALPGILTPQELKELQALLEKT